ncbi:MAG: GNAT family N-acetyltransferase, partial [Ignavibacteria bacterium]|nr:GNAT family N-acetyltransferase [Ignavibacteria bacterium]
NQGYGYISDDIPELSMSVLEEYRNIGIGSELLTSLFNELRNRRIAKVSLSVDKRNKAFNFYKRNGFIISEELDYSVKMIKEL